MMNSLRLASICPEDAEVPLELGAGLAVLVVHVEQEHNHGHAWPPRRAHAARRLWGRGWVPRGGLAGLGRRDRHAAEPLLLQGGH